MSTTLMTGCESAMDEVNRARLDALAQSEGMSVEDTLAMVIHVGLEFCETKAMDRNDRMEELVSAVRDIQKCLHLAGRAALGSNLLLAHWASRSGGVRVSEEELSRELDAVGESRWASQLAELGVPCPVGELELA